MTPIEQSGERVVLAHGGGGELMQRLIRSRILPPLLASSASLAGRLRSLTDGVELPWSTSSLVFTTDSYVVTPIEFPGGDIGKLAVCGTVNDLAVMGANPVALSLGLILDEGLPLETLDRIMRSVAASAQSAGVAIVTGDTKVVERRPDASPGVLINTAGIGALLPAVGRSAEARLAVERIEPGDCVLINGAIAEHGLAILSVRNGLEFETALQSDAAPLNHLIANLLSAAVQVRFLRDATRGGVAGVLADICDGSGCSIEVDESQIPISATARNAAEMLGLDPLSIANEGKVIAVVSGRDRLRALEILRSDPLGRHAACIGVITEKCPPLIELITRVGGRRIVQRPYGEETPRIC